jgi:D-alanine-D-alanine ligase
MKKLDVLMIHDGIDPLPDKKDFDSLAKSPEWGTEIAVVRAMETLGHSVRHIGFDGDVAPFLDETREQKPDVIFNLAESCLGEYLYDKNIPAVLELVGIPYTGCGPVGLMICNDKAITKKILVYHDILVPRFCVYRIGENVKFPKVFNSPFFVKPLQEEASTGICQRSFAATEDLARERVGFVHNNLKKDALVEEFIEGRELYVGIMGNGKNIKALPVWELKFTKVPDEEPRIATYRAKWDDNYRKKWGIKNECADPIPADIENKIIEACKKAYRVLNLDGYARFDLRLTPQGEVYIIEANANPELARGEDFAASAEKDGISYEDLIGKIIQLAIQRSA